jgi:superkiller protein 3
MSGLNISNMKVALCRGLLDVSDVGKLKEAFEMVSSEEHSSLLSRVVRGILCVRMHSYQQARRELEQCVKGISSLPVCWEKEYGISFNMLLAECSVGLEEWSDALETLSEVCTHVDKVFVRQHINPLKIQAYLGQGDLGHAEKMIAKLPQDQVPTMTMKAEVMLKTKDIPSAVEVLQGALELDPKSFGTHYLLGVGCWEWSEGARRKDAYKHFVKAASLDPYHSNTYYHLGLYFESLVKDQAKAVQCYRKAVERSPGNEAAAKALAGLLAEKKDEEELLALYKHVTSSCSLEKSKWAWMRMGLLQKSKTQYTTALTSLFNVVKANPKDSECWECIAETYFSRGSYTSALKSFNKALEINPESLYCKTWIAKTKAILGDMAEACKDYTAVLSKDPSYLLALKGLGETHYKIAREKLKENFDGQAVDHIQQSLLFLVKAARLKPGFSSIWKALGDACICLVDVDLDSSPWKLTVPSELTGTSSIIVTKAELLEITSKLYVQVCHIQPNSSYVWHDMAVCLYHRSRLSVEDGKREEFCGAAIESMKKATNLTPNDAHHWCTLGVMATMMGSSHYAMAQDAFIRSLNISEQDPTAWTNLGILYLKADNVKLAHECFRRALSADPAHQPAWVCEARVAEIIGETAEAVDMYRHATELEYSDESCRQYAQLVCDTLNSLPHQSVVRQDGAGLNAVAMRSVLQSRTSMDKYIKRHPDDVVALNLFGLLCEHEGLLEQATTAFQRALACVKMANHGDLKAFVESNLARVLVERNDPDLCKKAAKLYSNQIDSKDHVTLAYKALAHYCAKQYEEADKDFSLAVESCPSEVKSLFLATRAMASFELNPSFGKELLFQAFQTPPPSVFSLVGLISFGVVSNDFTLAMAAVEELIKMKDWSKEALHPNCIDNLLYIRICLLDSPEGASCLQRINDFWSVLKENDFYSDLLVKKESLMSVLEHQRSGNLDKAKLSAAKYYHNFPSHVELIPFILDTLQLSCV